MKVKLKVPHTHAGKPQKAGEVIDMSKADASWLIATGRAVPISERPAPLPKPTAAPTQDSAPSPTEQKETT